MPTHYDGDPAEKLALDAFIKLTRAVNALETRLSDAGSMGDLTATQFGVLETLFHLGDLSLHELGGKLLKSGGNITLVVDNLEKRGLVKRQRCQTDRRVIYASLTEAGRNLISAIFPRHAQSIVKSMSVLNADELNQLSNLCRKLGKAQINLK